MQHHEKARKRQWRGVHPRQLVGSRHLPGSASASPVNSKRHKQVLAGESSTPSGESTTRASEIPTAQAAATKLHKLSQLRPSLAIILGSGFHHVLSQLETDARISYAELPGFPKPSVTGHAGELFIGYLARVPVIVLSGRAHFYEGYEMAAVTFAVRTLASYGVTDVVLTNAAGGINRRFKRGDFMAITDHINLMGVHPLRGPAINGLERFVDLSCAYDPDLRRLLTVAARKSSIKLRQGIYLAVSGPSYETPAEVRAFSRLGADAVGMSTVPETIVARQCGLRVAGLSCITNLAAGCASAALSHREVLETAEQVKILAARLLKNLVNLYAKRR